MWELFFVDVPANSFIATNEEIKASFLQGGYYSVKIQDLLFVSLNGMYPFPKNKEQSVNGTTLMLNWLEDTLSLN